MEENEFSVNLYLTDLQILQETADQIKKDFSFFSLEITFSGNKEEAYSELYNQIYPHIKNLMDSDYEKFLSLLYRIDLNEKQIYPVQSADKSEEPAKTISGLIIKRCLQKVILRKLYST
ncbi:MAG TPA: hypothetical protein VNZ49_01090 [Bacteroidia bacterium]|jgi:hypothetical protein|nr:hypothetical protein [Bacteroidia bacterium]